MSCGHAVAEVITAEQRVEDWIWFHLARASRSRRRLDTMIRSTPEYGAENTSRQQSLQEAAKHVAILRGLGYPFPPALREAMTTEGVQ